MKTKKYIIISSISSIFIIFIIVLIMLLGNTNKKEEISSYAKETPIDIRSSVNQQLLYIEQNKIKLSDEDNNLSKKIDNLHTKFVENINLSKNIKDSTKQSEPNKTDVPSGNLDDINANIQLINKIKINKGFILFYKDDCKYCENVKSVLKDVSKSSNVEFKMFNLDNADDKKIIVDYYNFNKDNINNQSKFEDYSFKIHNFIDKSSIIQENVSEIKKINDKYNNDKVALQKNNVDFELYESHMNNIKVETDRLVKIVDDNVLGIIDCIYNPTLDDKSKIIIINKIKNIMEIQNLNSDEILTYIQSYISSTMNTFYINEIPTSDFSINVIYDGKLSQTITKENFNHQYILTDDVLNDKDKLKKHLTFQWK